MGKERGRHWGVGGDSVYVCSPGVLQSAQTPQSRLFSRDIPLLKKTVSATFSFIYSCQCGKSAEYDREREGESVRWSGVGRVGVPEASYRYSTSLG